MRKESSKLFSGVADEARKTAYWLPFSLSFIRGAFQKTKKTPYPYVLFLLFLFTLSFSWIGSCYSKNNLAYGFANYCQHSIISGENESVVFRALPKNQEDETVKKEFSQAVFSVNENYRKQATSFLCPVTDTGDKLPFSVSTETANAGNVFLADFIDYFSEEYNRTFLATVRLEVLDKRNENISFRNFPFKGKDASSYIPLSLAEKIVASSNGAYSDVLQLIGTRLDVSASSYTYHLSINNIYRTDVYSGPMAVSAIGEAIITNLPAIYTNHSWGMFSSSCSDAISIVGIQKVIGTRFSIVERADPYFYTKEGGLFKIDLPYDFQRLVQSMGSSEPYSILSSIFLIAGVFFWIVEALVLIFLPKKNGVVAKDLCYVFIVEFLLFGLAALCIGLLFLGKPELCLSFGAYFGVAGFLEPISLFLLSVTLSKQVERKEIA
ncbi:MAG: hypothetical protein ACI32C_04375 [Candidatus Enteromonas sp.]